MAAALKVEVAELGGDRACDGHDNRRPSSVAVDARLRRLLPRHNDDVEPECKCMNKREASEKRKWKKTVGRQNDRRLACCASWSCVGN
jgi:hypothetical protein